MLLSGRGVVCDNVFWGNVKPSAIEVSIENLNDLTPLTDLAEQKVIKWNLWNDWKVGRSAY